MSRAKRDTHLKYKTKQDTHFKEITKTLKFKINSSILSLAHPKENAKNQTTKTKQDTHFKEITKTLKFKINSSILSLAHPKENAMPTARKNHVSLDATPYYHCIGRCVRRAFLWGEDPVSGQDFSHRKLWVIERLTELSRSFAVNICAYAVISNHYHLVLHVDAGKSRSWSETEVAQ